MAPFETITVDNHGPLVMIVDYILIVLTGITVAACLLVRIHLKKFFVLNDTITVSAFVRLLCKGHFTRAANTFHTIGPSFSPKYLRPTSHRPWSRTTSRHPVPKRLRYLQQGPFLSFSFPIFSSDTHRSSITRPKFSRLLL